MNTVKIRSRCGSWNAFERRFKPRTNPDDTILVDLFELPQRIDPHLVWTVTDDDGRLYLSPGFRFVNRFAYLICTLRWTEIDERQPLYRYD